MSIFGIKTETNLKQFHRSTCLEEQLVAQILKRAEERKIFLKFLHDTTSSGQSVFETMKTKACGSIKDEDIEKIASEEVRTFLISELKAKKNGDLNLYETIVFDMVSKMDEKIAGMQKRLEVGKIDPCQMPTTYPSLRNKAEVLLLGKITSDMSPKDKKAYLTRKRLEQEVRKMTQEMFFAVNKLKLEDDQLANYLKLMFELSNLFASDPVRYNYFRELVADSIKTGKNLNMLTMKCLRMVYPKGLHFRILETMEDVSIVNKESAEHFPTSETKFFDRIERVRSLFLQAGVNLNLTVLIADLDLDDYFPNGGEGVVPDADIIKAHESVGNYLQDVTNHAPRGTRVLLLSKYLKETEVEERYYKDREKVLSDLKKRGSFYVDDNLVERRIDYRYDSNGRIFVNKPNRQFARERTYAQLASLRALEVLNDGSSFLLVEPKGDEEKLIGGKTDKSLPVMFVQLRG